MPTSLTPCAYPPPLLDDVPLADACAHPVAVGAGAPAAIGALTEDPKSFGKALIFVALGEGIALYGMLISILILSRL